MIGNILRENDYFSGLINMYIDMLTFIGNLSLVELIVISMVVVVPFLAICYLFNRFINRNNRE